MRPRFKCLDQRLNEIETAQIVLERKLKIGNSKHINPWENQNTKNKSGKNPKPLPYCSYVSTLFIVWTCMSNLCERFLWCQNCFSVKVTTCLLICCVRMSEQIMQSWNIHAIISFHIVVSSCNHITNINISWKGFLFLKPTSRISAIEQTSWTTSGVLCYEHRRPRTGYLLDK